MLALSKNIFLRFSLFTAALIIGSFGCTSYAADFKKGDIIVEAAWARPTHQGVENTAGYLHIINKGDKDEYLVSAESTICQKTQLHSMAVVNQVMKMRKLRKPILIKAHGDMTLKPGGYHVMFMKVVKEIKEGSNFPAILYFKNSGSLAIKFDVKNPDTK